MKLSETCRDMIDRFLISKKGGRSLIMLENDIRYYNIGGMIFCLEGPGIDNDFYLDPFRIEKGKADVTIRVSIDDIRLYPEAGEKKGDWCILSDGSRVKKDYQTGNVLFQMIGVNDRLVWIRYNSALAYKYISCCGNIVFAGMELPRRMMLKNQVFLHSSLITVGGRAILFTAKSQTGKSTQAALWENFRGADVINGDRSLLKKQNGEWYACGSPYCGSSKICKKGEFPIRAIVILSQAKENTAAQATPHAIFSALMNGFTYDVSSKFEVETVTEIASDLISSVPFYTLACTPDERAIEALESVLSASENH